MRGTSRVSLERAAERFEPVLGAAGAQAAGLGEQLFAVVDALDSSGSLRRTLTDPSIDGDAKAGVVRQLLADADPQVVELVSDMVRSRWSAEPDLATALEELGFHALIASAEAGGEQVRVEDELFRLTRALVGQREARRALADESVAVERRLALIDQILAGRTSPVTAAIARRATASPRGRRFAATLGHVGELSAARRQRLVAAVTTGSGLSVTQQDRLEGILARAYGRPVKLNVTVDEAVVGGLRIQVGSDVVDATVLSRLDDARRRLAS
ncbi:F0F1 ATP synthase subunit delta [Cellulomonas fimi]|uniref:ATP synthase subunit delta n=1 Tax=Cellulomonas fimi TaxID=1708 RepID=A0A7Y0QI68_CELFI|nr:F0F1 ATP synthase subunit delta [Cellulomonas fimi]NMR19952.1 F0F1 ATP synthase subunit delta [Cellulomonas fimi]